jgi:hypothetical protein
VLIELLLVVGGVVILPLLLTFVLLALSLGPIAFHQQPSLIIKLLKSTKPNGLALTKQQSSLFYGYDTSRSDSVYCRWMQTPFGISQLLVS